MTERIKFKKSEELKICKNYLNNISIINLASMYNVSSIKIRNILKKHNILGMANRSLVQSNGREKKYKINEKFFETIDNQEKAYVLGFLYADGNLHKNKNNFSIELSEKDIKILKKIKSVLQSNHKLFKHIQYNKKYKKYYIGYRLTVCNVKMCNDLLKIGVVSNKSLNIKFPDIKINLLCHFIRGYFDGDGSIYHYKRIGKRIINDFSGVEFALLGSNHFCKSLYKLFKRKINVIGYCDKSGENQKISRFRVSKRSDIKKKYLIGYINHLRYT